MIVHDSQITMVSHFQLVQWGGYIALQRQSQARENVIEKVEYKPSL